MADNTCPEVLSCEDAQLALDQIFKRFLLQSDGQCISLKAMAPITSDYRKTDLTKLKTTIKVVAGNVYGWNIINSNAFDIFVKFYDALIADVTVGTTVPKLTIRIPANGSIYQSPDSVQHAFSIGIVYLATKFVADSDTTDVANTYSNVFYK